MKRDLRWQSVYYTSMRTGGQLAGVHTRSWVQECTPVNPVPDGRSRPRLRLADECSVRDSVSKYEV